MKRTILTLLIAIAIVTGACGCRHKDQNPEDEELLLYCAAGIRPAAEKLIEAFQRRYEIDIAVDYAGSEVLLSRLKVGRKGDLYMPGDKHYVDQAQLNGMILSRQVVSYWVPVIFVQKGNPKNINGLADLLRDDVKTGLGDPKVCAIGRTSKMIMEKNGFTWDDVVAKLKFQSLTVNELGTQIQIEALDAVIVWDAIAKYFGDGSDMIAIPIEKNVTSSIDVGVLSFTKNQTAADKFVEFITSNKGKAILKEKGYRTEPVK